MKKKPESGAFPHHRDQLTAKTSRTDDRSNIRCNALTLIAPYVLRQTLAINMRFFRLLSTLLLLLPLSAMSANEQKVSALNANDTAALVKQRQVLEKYLGDERSKQNYKTVAGKLGLLRALLDQKIFKPTQSYEYGCMGVVLGDAFAQELKMEWVVVEDAQGRDFALRLPKTSILIFPVGMILKRVMRGETVDVFDVFNGVADHVENLRKKGT